MEKIDYVYRKKPENKSRHFIIKSLVKSWEPPFQLLGKALHLESEAVGPKAQGAWMASLVPSCPFSSAPHSYRAL